MKRVGIVERWYGALLKLLPGRVRQEYGSDMLLTFEQRLVERPRWRRPAFVIRETAAVVQFGIRERLAQAPRQEPRRSGRLDVLGSNTRTGLRTLLRNPGFTAVAVLILGVGIGLTTAIFSALDTVLLRSSPYVDAHELVNVERTGGSEAAVVPWPHAHFELVRERGGPFVDVAAHGTSSVTLTGWGEPLRLTAEFVSDNYLSLLGIEPQFGRAFVPGGDRAVSDREVLLSDRAWRERFGGGEVLGVGLTLNGRTAVVAGVLPAGFHGESGDAEVFAPIELAPDMLASPSLMQPWVMWLSVTGRLRAGVRPEAAAAHMMTMNEQLLAAGEYPIVIGDEPIAVRPLHGSRIDPAFRRALLLTFGAAGLVMVIVCLNISSLLLVRTQGRDRELAIRGALGASRARLIGQLVTESMLLATIGGAAGLVIASGALDVLTALRPAPTPGFWSSYARAVDVHEFRLDMRVLAFACILTLLAGVASGLLPALRAYTTGFAVRLRGVGDGAAAGPRWARTRAGIVTAEIALAFVLVTAAALVVTSLTRMQREDLGFTATEVMTMRLQPSAGMYSLERTGQFYESLVQQLADMPGAVSVSLSTGLPVTGRGGTSDFVPEMREGEDLPTIDMEFVSPGHFETLGIPLRTGRGFTEADVGGPIPVVVSAAAADYYWPGENPIGRRAYANVAARTQDPVEVIGVVGDVQYRGVGEHVGPLIYLPLTRLPKRHLYVNLRTAMPPAAAAAAMRAAVSRLEPSLAISEIRTMRERMGAATSRARFSAVLVSAFAAVAALLAVLGIYGLIAYSVRARSHEFGIRLALGGRPRAIIGLMLGDVFRIAVAGTVLGVVGAMAFARILASQLYGVAATEPRLLVAVGLLTLTAAALAAAVPALRVLQISASAELMCD